MTVRVRQLTRVPSGAVPPVPPPPIVPIMEFTVQPSNTDVGELFVPTVEVTITPASPDSLTISSDNCAIAPVTVTAGPGGLAIFSGLAAGSTLGTGCRLRVHNNSNPNVADVLSNPFNITQPPLQLIEIVNSGNAYGINAATSLVTLTNQANGELFDTTGADLLFGTFISQEPNSQMIESRSNVYTNLLIPPISIAGIPIAQAIYSNPYITGTGITSWAINQVNTFAAIAAIAMSGVLPGPPMLVAASSNNDGLVGPFNIGPFIINRTNAVIISAVSGYVTGASESVIGQSNYPDSISVNYVEGTHFGLTMAWKIGALTTETVTWNFPIMTFFNVITVVFEGINQP